MEKHRGLWLPIPGFDELMLIMGHALGYPNQAARIRSDADGRAMDYERTLAEAVKSLRSVPCQPWCPQLEQLAAAAELHLLGAARLRTWNEWRVALKAAPSAAERAQLFTEALAELKDSPELKAAYASFVAEQTPQAEIVDATVEEARQLAERSAGVGSVAMLAVLHEKARILSMRSLKDEALELAQDVLASRRTLLGDEHADTLRTADLVGTILDAQGRYSDAEAVHKDVLEARKRTLGAEHADTLASMNNLANSLLEQERYAECESLHRRGLESSERQLGHEHPDTLISINNLANVLVKQGRYSEAEELYRRALGAGARTLGPDNVHTLSVEVNLGSVLAAMGRHDEAEQRLERAERGLRSRLGDDDDRTIEAASELAALRTKRANLDATQG
jgi:tetratricopeptide (TPR) repeat protein